MLAYFPRPYENETIYSIAARYAMHMGILSKRNVLKDLFEIVNPTSSEDYTFHIYTMVNKIKHFSNEYTDEYFLNKHTVSPLYSPFIKDSSGNPSRSLDNFIKGKKRYRWDIPEKENLFYCSECVEEDLEKYGECYWNRIFQIPGIMICGKHERPLSKSQLNIHRNPLNKFIMPNQEEEEIKIDNGIFEQLLDITKNVEYFFTNKVNTFNYQELYEKYFEFIKIASIAIPLSNLKKKLGELIISRFNEKTLDFLNSNPRKNDWLSYLSVERIKHIHPIRHVLLMMSLALSVERFTNIVPKYQPFGNGAWICMNSLSKHYLENVVTNINITFNKDIGNFQGEFKCSCGFTYVLYNGENNPCNISKFSPRVKEKGHIWRKEFDALVSKGASIKEIALKTNYSTGTVRKIIKQGHNYYENEKKRRQQNLEERRIVREKKDKMDWNEIRRKYPNSSRTELMYENKALYNRILRYDREWLMENSPTSQRGAVKTSNDINHKRDVLYLKEAQDMLENWSEYEKQAGKIIKKTQFTLYTRLGMKARNNDKYPLTVSYISTFIESNEDYQIRLINQCIENHFINSEIKRYRILEYSGLRYLHPKAEKYLEVIINENNKRN